MSRNKTNAQVGSDFEDFLRLGTQRAGCSGGIVQYAIEGAAYAKAYDQAR